MISNHWSSPFPSVNKTKAQKSNTCPREHNSGIETLQEKGKVSTKTLKWERGWHIWETKGNKGG